ncbi:hypothetical protein [Bradyrhizobium icense]|uniref:hypothetical protein n=1 Tax=Bradyrhizobium icense TaxID=1274631 RepID=UPI0012EAB6AA|nr:hypothetical protein [Bradyrhizobium icense]
MDRAIREHPQMRHKVYELRVLMHLEHIRGQSMYRYAFRVVLPKFIWTGEARPKSLQNHPQGKHLGACLWVPRNADPVPQQQRFEAVNKEPMPTRW